MELKLLIIQLIGILGCIIGISGFLNKNDKILKYCMSSSSLLFSIHYFLLDAWTAASLKLVNTFRNFFSIKHSSTWLMVTFILFYWVSGIYFAKNILDYITVITISISTFGMFKLNGIKLRIAFLPSIIAWIAVGIYNQSIGGIILESFVLTSNLITIFRMKKDSL